MNKLINKQQINQQQTIELNRILLMKSSRLEKKVYKRAELIRINPKSFRDAKQIAKELRNYNAIIVDLEAVSDKDAVRIMDFVSGTLFALGGKHKKLSSRSFLLAPLPDLIFKFSQSDEE